MAWNGSNDKEASNTLASTKSKAKKPSPLRGALAGVVVVLLALVVAFFLVSRQKNDIGEKRSGKRGMIEAVKPAHTERLLPVVKPSPAAKNVDELLSRIVEKPKTEIKTRPVSPEEWKRLTNRVFKTGTDQLLSWVCQVTPGDMPMPIPSLGEEEKKNILGILMSKIQVKETDDDKLANLKEDINFAKKEMASYIAQGGDPDDFLQYYFKELNRAFEYRNEVRDQISQAYEDGDKELAREFRKKANAMLAERGIKTLPLSDFEEEDEIPDGEKELQ